MPRISHVKKARKSPGNCTACGKTIEPGEAYKWFALFRSPANSRHESCPDWKGSEMTGSQYESQLLGAIEDAESEVNGWDSYDIDDLESIRDTVAESLRDAASEYEEGAQNIEDGFQHETEKSQEMREKADSINSVADSLEGIDFEDLDVYDIPEKPKPEDFVTEGSDDDDKKSFDEAFAKWKEENADNLSTWAQAQRDLILEELGNVET